MSGAGRLSRKLALDGVMLALILAEFAYGLTGSAAREAIERVVGALGLEPYWGTGAGLLPLGIKQRLALGAAVLHHWKLPLVLTEPINLHHSPELATSFKMEARLLAVANCLARYSHDTPATLGDDVLEYLPHGCDPETVSAAVFQSMANAQSAGFAELNA